MMLRADLIAGLLGTAECIGESHVRSRLLVLAVDVLGGGHLLLFDGFLGAEMEGLLGRENAEIESVGDISVTRALHEDFNVEEDAIVSAGCDGIRKDGGIAAHSSLRVKAGIVALADDGDLLGHDLLTRDGDQIARERVNAFTVDGAGSVECGEELVGGGIRGGVLGREICLGSLEN